nr:S8 family serine peptidase [Mycobacterium tilburgii]
MSNVVRSGDFEAHAMDLERTRATEGTVFDALGVAVVSADPDQLTALQTASSTPETIRAVEPELVHHVLADSAGPSIDYMRGYRDGVTDLSGRINDTTAPLAAALPAFQDTAQFTWGLQATAVSTSPRSGHGVSVAVLDTGLDLSHPDFAGRPINAQSFVAGVGPQDGHGHGTHCIGTSCGPQTPPDTRRYGVAYGADIYVGKVLDDSGSGVDQGILAGINWAVTNGCNIISMSLGADVPQVSRAYERVGRRALAAGTLIVAAAGNNARRPGDPGFVGVPANSPSIMAVGALDSQLNIASFSARSNPVNGGQVDIAAPGVAVYSSWPMPTRYNTISGTSMATPHVSGIAALWAEATGQHGLALWGSLVQHARRIPVLSVDVGSGLVQAPQ